MCIAVVRKRRYTQWGRPGRKSHTRRRSPRTTRSTKTDGAIHADVCSQCHPFYTGKQKILDTGGRVARFEKRYAQAGANKKK